MKVFAPLGIVIHADAKNTHKSHKMYDSSYYRWKKFVLRHHRTNLVRILFYHYRYMFFMSMFLAAFKSLSKTILHFAHSYVFSRNGSFTLSQLPQRRDV
jgi:hypothetical protein